MLNWTCSLVGVCRWILLLMFLLATAAVSVRSRVSVCFWSYRPQGVTCLSCRSPCLTLSVSAKRTGSGYFCVRSAFINISLLGDKLMSPGSLIATSPNHIRHFLCFVTMGALHHLLWSTFATKQWAMLDWRGKLFFFFLRVPAHREQIGNNACDHI